MRSNGASRSSATICRSAVDTPVPNSTLPQNTVIEPSAETASHESSWVAGGATDATPVDVDAWSRRDPPNEKPTTRTPLLFRNSRRENALLIVASLFIAAGLRDAQLRGSLDGPHDPHVCATATEIPVERGANLLARRSLGPRDERGRRHDHSVDAVGALRGLLVDERLLHRMRLVDRAEALDRRDRAAGRGGKRSSARANRGAVDVHHARAALPKSAPELGSREPQVITQDVEERGVRRGGHVARRAVDDQSYGGARRHTTTRSVGLAMSSTAREPMSTRRRFVEASSAGYSTTHRRS